MIVLGIDPGLSGAIAEYDRSNVSALYGLTVFEMPTVKVARNGKLKRELDLAKLADIIYNTTATVAYVERVGAMPGQGVTSMFSFGKSYGSILGILAAFKIPVVHVAPQTWRKHLSVRKGKDGSRMTASELLPKSAHIWPLVKDDGKAEASLIALYGERHANQEVKA
jgi:crossover junction endodeoxyribonuclease RuvC